MVNIFDAVTSWFKGASKAEPIAVVDMLSPTASAGFGSTTNMGVIQDLNGDKFIGGFGTTKLYNKDYWTLRQRSEQLFSENLYASGIIRRLVTHEINTGLSLEASPLKTILKLDDEYIENWAENVEDLYKVWEWDRRLCDHSQMRVYGEILGDIRSESLITGDVLMVVRRNAYGLPCVQTISGSKIDTPLDKWDNPKIKHGVEVDSTGQHIAYYIQQDDGSFKRLPALSSNGRRVAWLVYGSPKRMDDVRGLPLLTIILQSLKEIDRYRDATQRKAVINSILAMYIKKAPGTLGTMPISGGAVRRDDVVANSVDGPQRSFELAGQIPGLVYETLEAGEEPVGFDSKGTDLNFPVFEKAVLDSVAWSVEIPPSKMTLMYSSNYSASQAEINDFKTYLNKARTFISCSTTQPMYEEVLLSFVVSNKVQAPGFIESWVDKSKYDIYGAWVYAEWIGVVQPSMDINKTTKALVEQINNGLTTRKRAGRELNGTASRDIFRTLEKEAVEMNRINSILNPPGGAQ